MDEFTEQRCYKLRDRIQQAINIDNWELASKLNKELTETISLQYQKCIQNLIPESSILAKFKKD